MDAKYPTLKRPRRKLCYLTNKKSLSKEWADKFSLENIDGMFDDLDSPLPVNDISPLQTSDESKHSKGQISPVLQKTYSTVKLPESGRHILNSARRSLAPELENVEALNIPVKQHEPLKMSSPIEERIVVEEDTERAPDVPRFPDFEEPNTDLVANQIPQCNTHVKEEEVDCGLESPPSWVTLSKPKTSSHKKQAATPCKESLPTKKTTPNKPERLAESKTPRQPSGERSISKGNIINTFLQKVRNAERTKPAGGLQALVKVPTPPPEPEDDFLILEDDAPLVYIPSKSIRKTQRQKETKVGRKGTDQDCLIDKRPTDGQTETVFKAFSSGDSVEQERPNKKKQQDKKALKQLINKDRRKSEEANFEKMKSETQKSSNVTRLKSAKEKAKKNKKTKPQDLDSHSETEIHGAQIGKTVADEMAEQISVSPAPAGSSSEESEVLQKRKRKPPGKWWLSCPQNTEDTKVIDNQPTTKKSKLNKELTTELPSPVEVKKRQHRHLKKCKEKPSAPAATEPTAAEKKTKRGAETPDKRKTTDVEQPNYQDEQLDVPGQDQYHESPLVFAQRDINLDSAAKVFQRVYSHVASENTAASVPTRRPEQQPQTSDGKTGKRRRTQPGNWWLVNSVSEDIDRGSAQLHKPHQPRKERNKSKTISSPRLGTPKNDKAVSSKLQGRTAPHTLKHKPWSGAKTKQKRSLLIFKDNVTSAAETEIIYRDECQNNRPNVNVHPAEEVGAFCQNGTTSVDSTSQSKNIKIKELNSGPSSMLQLEQYEETDDFILPSSRDHLPLQMSDLCAPPLKPLILQPEDEANLAEWFKTLWASVPPNAAEVSPDQFDWFVYKDKALGLLLDVHCGPVCIGRLLLGSYTKKPLWVDHSASTVFNVVTSSVIVVIDSKESRFHAGQCFTVQCGRAYSIQNITAQPAVLYFTRILTEGSD